VNKDFFFVVLLPLRTASTRTKTATSIEIHTELTIPKKGQKQDVGANDDKEGLGKQQRRKWSVSKQESGACLVAGESP